ncbi:MAG: hypothetical protein R3C18_26020 [Planctomycetaceae bacterium]
MDRTASVMNLAGDAADRVTFDANLSATNIADISCGVIFVHAFWAGSSVTALKRFCEMLVRVDPNRRLTFTVCNIDEIEPERIDLYAGDHTGGNGDIVWVRDGVVLARHNASRCCDLEATTRNLLAE